MYNKKINFLKYKEKILSENNIVFATLSNLTCKEADEIRSDLFAFDNTVLTVLKRTLLEKILNVDLKEFTRKGLKIAILQTDNISFIIKELSKHKKITFSHLPGLCDPNKFKVACFTKQEYIARIVFLLRQKFFDIIKIIMFKVGKI
jgi:hypothetical protein